MELLELQRFPIFQTAGIPLSKVLWAGRSNEIYIGNKQINKALRLLEKRG
jgi:hypothetical protein